jgi:hypothetical protein
LRGRDRWGHSEEGTEEVSNRGGEMEGERARKGREEQTEGSLNLNINMYERGTQ